MASGTSGDSNDDFNWRGMCRWTENSKVYTRKSHKKAQKASNDNVTPTTSVSVSEEPVSAVLTPSRNQASTSAEATAAEADISHPDTGTPNGVANCYVSDGVVGSKDVDSSQNLPEHCPQKEQSLANGPPDKKADSLGQAPLLERRGSQHVTSVAEDIHQTDDRVEEDRGSQSAELQVLWDLEGLPLPDNNKAKNLEKTRSPDGEKELVQRSETSVASENDIPNGREVSAERQPVGDDEQNDEAMPGSFQLPQENGLIVKSPELSKEQQVVGNEAQDNEEMMLGSPQASGGNDRGDLNGVVASLVISNIGDNIRFTLCRATPKNEIKAFRKNLEDMLDQVRMLVKQLESKEHQLALQNNHTSNNNLSNKSNYIGIEGVSAGDYVYPQPQQHGQNNMVDRRLLLRVNTEMGAMGHTEIKPVGLA